MLQRITTEDTEITELNSGNVRIEKTEIRITCEKPLEGNGRAVRGFFGNLYRNRPES
jgi:hypothetical protein